MSLLHDLRYATRTLLRTPVFAFVVLLILALGIGANTAVFSIVNAVLIRPLGFAEAERLVMLYGGVPSVGIMRVPFSAADLLDVERDARSFDAVAAFRNAALELSGDGDSERVAGTRVTANLFPTLGIEPALGRLFARDEDRPGSDLALISWGLWQRRYAGSPDVIGRSIQIDRRPYTVIGVMPASLEFPRRGLEFNGEPADVWIPMAFIDQQKMGRGGGFENSVIARLAAGVTLTQAQTELDILAPRIQATYPPALRDANPLKLSAHPLHAEIAGRMTTPLLMLLGAIGLVLLVACANVANLLLSRAAVRERELGVRAALGATRLDLLRMQLAEVLLLAAAGGTFAIVIARLVLSAVPAAIAERVPGLSNVPLDLRVVVFAGGLALVTAVLFGLLPLFSTELRDPSGIVREAMGRTTAGVRRHRLQNGLVVSTVALAFVLLVSAGLFLRSFTALVASDPGFRSGGVLTASLSLPQAAYPTAAQVHAFHEAVVQRAGDLPGVRAAAVMTDLPSEAGPAIIFTPEGGTLEAGTALRPARRSWVHGPYFRTLGIPLVRGRLFTEEEYRNDRQVVIVNQKLAEQYWPGEDPIGKRIVGRPWLTIVGVVGDVIAGSQAVTVLGDDRPVHIYEPFRQLFGPELTGGVSLLTRTLRLAVLTGGDPTRLAGPIRQSLASLDPQLAVASISSMDERMGETVAPQRFSTTLLTAFAGGALLLVAMGLYGLLAFTVAQRTREIGVRIALGAEPGTVVGLVMRHGLTLVGVGLVLGLAAALGATRLFSSQLYEVGSYDPVTFVTVPVVLTAVTLLACGIPAFRASRIDPIDAMRRS